MSHVNGMSVQELEAIFSERQIVVLIDNSGSMATRDCKGGVSRLEMAKEWVTTLCHDACRIDADGIDIITFGTTVEVYKSVTESNVDAVLAKMASRGTTPMLEALKEAHRLMDGKKCFYVIITDGEPDNGESGKVAVAKEIVASVNKQQNDDDQTHLFIQFGYDSNSTKFLQFLDDDLQSKFGAKHDAVDVIPADEIAKYSCIAEMLAKAEND
jgi:Mg-chelatase subunit ChlD